MSENLFTLFTARFPEDQSRAFLERTDGSVLTYADLLDRSGKLANTLLALGVKPGDRVAAQVERRLRPCCSISHHCVSGLSICRSIRRIRPPKFATF